jgi:hypothetical protein
VDLYRHDFLSFVRFVFQELYPGKRYIDGWHVEVMADALMHCAPGGEQRLIINVPPRYLKSLCASIAWPLFILARHPHLRIVVTAGTRELAAEFYELRSQLLTSKRFLHVFPNMQATPITDGWRFANRSELVQTIVGRSQIGRGADLIIIDDPISPSRARSQKACASINAWYDSEILPRLNNKASAGLIVVMQRLAIQDLCAHLLSGSDEWRHVALSAVARDDETWELTNGRVHHRPAHEVLCEELENREALLERLDQIGGLNFYAQYLQVPTTTPDGSNYRRFRRPTLVPEDWKPGMPTIPMIMFGRLNISADIRHRYFGGPDPDDRTGLREQTEEEWLEEFRNQQLRLVAEGRADRDRRRLPAG